MSFLFAQRGNARQNNVSRRCGPTGHHSRMLGEPAIVQGASAHAEASRSRSCAARGCVGATGHGQGIVSGAAPPFMKDETSAGAQLFEYGAPLLRSDAIDTKMSVARAGLGEVEQ